MAGFNPDIDKLASQLIMPALRKVRQLAWLRTLLFPFKYIQAQFDLFRAAISLQMSYDGTVVLLEKALNDKYDNVERRIYISDYDNLPREYTFFESEGQGDDGFTYFEAEGQGDDGFSYFYSEYVAQPHFVVNLPAAALLIDTEAKENEMRSYINRYKVAGKRYVFNEF